jgi:hypothetical protein
MAESARALLRRELAEINAGKRDAWSARALHRAARAVFHMSMDPERAAQRCRILANEIAGVEPGLQIDVTEPIVELESRTWLLNQSRWDVLPSLLAEEEEDTTGVPIDR